LSWYRPSATGSCSTTAHIGTCSCPGTAHPGTGLCPGKVRPGTGSRFFVQPIHGPIAVLERSHRGTYSRPVTAHLGNNCPCTAHQGTGGRPGKAYPGTDSCPGIPHPGKKKLSCIFSAPNGVGNRLGAAHPCTDSRSDTSHPNTSGTLVEPIQHKVTC
jgi:hypothetical protein